MKRYFNLLMLALFSTSMLLANTTASDPFADFLASEIERMELEQELFGIEKNLEDPISIAAVAVYELDEEINLGFNTSDYLPSNFNAKRGMKVIDWNTIKLYEVEEEIDLDVNVESDLSGATSF